MKLFSVYLLRFAEFVFLWAHGWRRFAKVDGKSDYYWNPPKNYPGTDHSMHRHGHAVNSLKYWVYNSWNWTRQKGVYRFPWIG